MPALSICCLSVVYLPELELSASVGLGAHEEEEGSDQGCDDESEENISKELKHS